MQVPAFPEITSEWPFDMFAISLFAMSYERLIVLNLFWTIRRCRWTDDKEAKAVVTEADLPQGLLFGLPPFCLGTARLSLFYHHASFLKFLPNKVNEEVQPNQPTKANSSCGGTTPGTAFVLGRHCLCGFCWGEVYEELTHCLLCVVRFDLSDRDNFFDSKTRSSIVSDEAKQSQLSIPVVQHQS